MPRFIAIDPSSTITGWAVFQKEGLIAWGKVDMAKAEYHSRFSILITALDDLARQYGIQEVAVEDISFAWHSKNRNRNIAGLQVVFQSIKKWADSRNLILSAYNPATWKNAVVGYHAASKEVTKNNVQLRFPGVPDNLTDHEYDAIAIGQYHATLTKLIQAEGESKCR